MDPIFASLTGGLKFKGQQNRKIQQLFDKVSAASHLQSVDPADQLYHSPRRRLSHLRRHQKGSLRQLRGRSTVSTWFLRPQTTQPSRTQSNPSTTSSALYAQRRQRARAKQ